MSRRLWWTGCCLVVLVWFSNAGVGTWRNYTSMKDVRGIARSGNTFWAATGGGLFSWVESSNAFTMFTNAEGLRSNDLTVVAVDGSGNIWTGSSTGVLHVYSPSTQSWQYILDISSSEQTNKRINHIAVHGDTVLISTGFGLSMFFIERFQFGDTYTKFGSLPTNARISVSSAAIHDGKVWAAISAGSSDNYVAVADLSNPNILPPEAWTLQIVSAPTTTIRSLSNFNSSLYAGTNSGLYVSVTTSWNPAGYSGNVAATDASNALLALCSTTGDVQLLDPLGNLTPFGTQIALTPTCLTLTSNDEPLVGSTTSGFQRFVSGAWQSILPNGPHSNQFISVAVEADGTAWGASGYSNSGQGFYRLRNGVWKSFTSENSGLPTNDYYRVSIGCNGSVWASSWGGGVTLIPAGQDTINPGNTFGNNVGMIGLPNDTTYIVTSNVACDTRGNHWMTIIRAANRNILAIQQPDGSWENLPLRRGGISLTTLLENPPTERTVAIDASGTVWFASQDPTFKGLVSLGNQGAIDDSIAYYLTDANGLPSNDVRTVIVDRDNDVWVGTDRGIAIILDPERPDRPGSIASYRPLNGLVINTIAVDPLNQKWVGTNEGVILLSQDGTQQLASYTVESTRGYLIENDIKSIAIDSQQGLVYFGTSSGLASLTTAGAAPREAFDELQIFPNPFIVPNASSLTIDGLIANSTLKILTVDGRLIRTLSTPGGRIGFWDGKDTEGRDAATGVYVIVAFSEDGSAVATGKVAVVRR